MKIFLQRHGLFLLCCVLSIGLLYGAYSDYFNNAFHFDDGHVVVSNLYIRSLKNIPQFFTNAGTTTSLPANAVYRPMVTLSLAFDYWWGGGLNNQAFHATQFLLLVLLGAFLFLFYRHLLRSRGGQTGIVRYVSLLAALFYCIHTANTETLNIISARSELLAALGVLGSFLLYMYQPRSRTACLYLLPMFLGALAKISAVIFAPLFFLYLLLSQEEISLRSIKASLIKALPAFVLGIATFLFVESMNHSDVLYATMNRWDYLLTQPFVWVRYLQLFFVPAGLSADSDWRILKHWYDARLFAGLVIIIILAALSIICSRSKQWRLVAFGLLWFMVALLPASSIFPLSEVTNDHRAFFSYVGLTLSAAVTLLYLWRWLGRRKRSGKLGAALVGCTIVALLCGHAWATHERNKVWQNDETLWLDVTKKSPNNGRGLMNYGLSQMKRGRLKSAKEYFERAKQFTPNYSVLEINLGVVNEALGQSAQAEPHFKRALQLAPKHHEANYYYGAWLLKQRRGPEALKYLEASRHLSAGHLPSKLLLMRVYAALGERDKLNALSQAVLALDPENKLARALRTGYTNELRGYPTAVAHYTHGLKFLGEKNYLAAAQSFQQALAFKKEVSSYNNLAWALEQLKFYEPARNFYIKGLTIDPDNERSRNNLSNLLKKINQS